MDLEAVARLGGKGAQTARLVELGLPVPASAVVPVDAYRRFATDPGVAELLQRIRRGEVVEADIVDACFSSAPVHADVVRQVRRLAAEVAGPGRLAVRSSATVEDLGGTSFAGQYRSFLGVAPDDVLDAVVLVWASLWHPAPCAYRRVHGVSEDGVAMAVLLMAMVDPVEAGVVFTIDPIAGPGSVRVEAVEGPGEALVSGAVTPRCWSLPRDEVATGPAPIAEAASLALQVEEAFGVPVDVEWAWDGTQVWLVQARPITVTAGDGFDTAVDDHRLTTAGIAEMLPGVLPPLVWQLAGTAVEEALRACFDAVGATDPGWTDPHRLVRRVRGRAAVDLDGLEAVASHLPGAAPGVVEHGYFGGGEPAPAGSRVRWWRSARHDLRVDAARRRARRDADVVVRAVEALGEAAAVDLAALGDDELLARRRQLVDLGFRAMAAELGMAAAATAACDQLASFVTHHLPEADEGARLARAAIAGVGGTQARAWASMSVFAGPTWQEVGVDPIGVIGVPNAGDAARLDLEARLRNLPRWRTTRILTGQVVDVRLHLLRRLVADARTMLGWRERTKAAVLALGGLVRAVHLELGSRLVVRDELPERTDIELLTDAEVCGRSSRPSRAEIGRRRRAVEQMTRSGPLPERFVGVPPADVEPLPTGDHLEGIGASSGRATARARVVRDPRHPRFRTGEVLVATATDAGWSPLFAEAAAIVVERGGPLSHAAIVARELGIPAVLDVHGATQRLDGHVVTVDGDAGVVVVQPSDAES